VPHRARLMPAHSRHRWRHWNRFNCLRPPKPCWRCAMRASRLPFGPSVRVSWATADSSAVLTPGQSPRAARLHCDSSPGRPFPATSA